MGALFQTNMAAAGIQKLYGQGIYTGHYDHTDSTTGDYVIQLSEYVIDDPNTGAGHTDTYDWFNVNPATGAYTSEFNNLSGTLPVIMILDPGHGGSDPGSIGIDMHESAATLIVCKEMEKYLNKHYNVQVIMTRTDNQTLPSLHDRAQMAIDNNANVIISHHYNHFDGTAHGYQDMIEDDGTGTYPQAQISIDLQRGVHANVLPILQKYGLSDRGSIGQDLQVLRDSYYQCPGMMMEGLFLDNAGDSEFFYNADFMDEYVPALCDGIAKTLGFPVLNPVDADFMLYKDGQIVAGYDTLDQLNAGINSFYNGGNVDDLEVVMALKKTTAPTAMQKVYDFVGKAKADGDSTRSIWYTGNYTTDQPPANVASEVNGGYAAVAVQGDGQYLSYSIMNAPVGREIQFEFDFNLFNVGDANFIATNVDKVTFHIVPKAGCKYYAKIWNPVTSAYELLATDSTGSGAIQDLVISNPNVAKYVSTSGLIRFTLFSYNKTLADNTNVEIDFDYAKLTVDFHE